MYDDAIDDLIDNKPLEAIAKIQRVLSRMKTEEEETVYREVREEIIHTTDFLERQGWIA